MHYMYRSIITVVIMVFARLMATKRALSPNTPGILIRFIMGDGLGIVNVVVQ
jgi:hypothetical protein